MNRVRAQEHTGRATARADRTARILKRSLSLLNLDQQEVHLTFVRDKDMIALNQTYRGLAKTTDVLSFEQHVQMGAFYFLGDIVISTDQTQKQNQKQAHRLKDEYAILAIHGLLHLLGHDHAEPDEKKVMFALQDHLYRKTRHEH